MKDPHVLIAVLILVVLMGLCAGLQAWMDRRADSDAPEMFPDLRWRNDK